MECWIDEVPISQCSSSITLVLQYANIVFPDKTLFCFYATLVARNKQDVQTLLP